MSNNSGDFEELMSTITNKPGRGRRKSAKIRPAPKLPKEMLETAMDDSYVFAENFKDGEHAVLAVYGVEDWAYSSIMRQRFLRGLKTVQVDGTWITPNDFDLATWSNEVFSKFSFSNANTVMAYTDELGTVKVMYGRGKIQVEITGSPEEVAVWLGWFNMNFTKAENMIEWVYNARGDGISVPLNYRPGIRAAYPWIDETFVNLTDYIDEYIDSEASVLILIGPPGTGKTTFIKNMIHRSKANAKVAYDPNVISQDDFFAGFIADETRFLVMEDADEFLRSRTDGNSMMHKFLNVSDGLISASDKKLVFSTNLPSINDIDEALMRPGRCFDVLQFRKLTREEAQAVLDEVGSTATIPDGKEISLAELFSTSSTRKVLKRRAIGFTA